MLPPPPRCALALLLVVGVAASAAIGAGDDGPDRADGHPAICPNPEPEPEPEPEQQPLDDAAGRDGGRSTTLDDADDRASRVTPSDGAEPPPPMSKPTIDDKADVDKALLSTNSANVMEPPTGGCAADAPPPSPASAAASPLVALSKASHEFAAQLYTQLSADERGNIVFSPFSVHTASAMVLQGSTRHSNTSTQLSRALALKAGRADRYNEEYKRLLASYDAADSAVKVGNRIYTGEGFKPRPDYLRVLKCKFQSPLEEVDFAAASAVAQVNKFISEKTNGKIPKLLDAIDASTRMMVVNAIFFKSDWRYKFRESDTGPQTFHVDSRRSFRHAEMMRTEISDFHKSGENGGATEYARLRTASADEIDAQVLELPYVDPKLRMKVFLPNQLDGIHLIDERITRLPQIKLKWEPQSQLEVTLPKFAARKKSDLVEAFKGLGATDMFSEQLADFKMISDEQLAVSKMLHEAVLEVNEAGSEAAAATVVGLATRIATEPTSFRVDRPFVFVIEYDDARSGHSIPLFMGRIVDPSADGARKLAPLTAEQRRRLRSNVRSEAAFAAPADAAAETLAQTERETQSVTNVVEDDGEEVIGN